MVTGLDWHAQWRPRRIATWSLWLLAPGWRGRIARLRDVGARPHAKQWLRRRGLEEQARALAARWRSKRR